jgi:hypothetical protein
MVPRTFFIQRAPIRFSLLAVNRDERRGDVDKDAEVGLLGQLCGFGFALAQQANSASPTKTPHVNRRWPGAKGIVQLADNSRLHHGTRLWYGFKQKPQDLFSRHTGGRKGHVTSASVVVEKSHGKAGLVESFIAPPLEFWHRNLSTTKHVEATEEA